MKSILTLLLIVPSLYNRINRTTPSSAKEDYQSSIATDKLFIEKLNQYRSYHKINPLIFDDTIYRMSKHHCTYMYKVDTVSHFEEIPVPDFILIKSLWNRANYFGVTLPVAENVVGGFVTIVINKRTPFSDFVKLIWKEKLADTSYKERAIYYCIYDWHLSKNGHKKIMLSDRFTAGAVSLRHHCSTINYKDAFFNGADTQKIRILAVLNVAD